MLSNIPGQSTFESTCEKNLRKVGTILTDQLKVSSGRVKLALECFRNPTDLGKANPAFTALAVYLDMHLDKFKSNSEEEKVLWDSYHIPTMASLLRFIDANATVINDLMQATKGKRISSDTQARALLRMWRFLQKCRESYRLEKDAGMFDESTSPSLWVAGGRGIDELGDQPVEEDWGEEDLTEESEAMQGVQAIAGHARSNRKRLRSMQVEEPIREQQQQQQQQQQGYESDSDFEAQQEQEEQELEEEFGLSADQFISSQLDGAVASMSPALQLD